MPTLQGVDLSKSYRGRKVVDNIELEIGQGEVVGLLGPNGAGKTTTFYMPGRPGPAGFRARPPEQCRYHRFAHVFAGRSGISYLPQEPSVFRQLTSRGKLAGRAGNPAPDAGATA